MKSIKNRFFVLIGCIFFQYSTSFSQDINFKDLSRTGPVIVKRYSIDGIEADGRAYLMKFDGVDSARVAVRNANIDAARSSGSSGSSSRDSSSGQSSAKSSPKNKTFVCEIYCKSGTGPRISRELSGSSRDEVARYIDANADGICKNSGISNKASGIHFSASQCKEK